MNNIIEGSTYSYKGHKVIFEKLINSKQGIVRHVYSREIDLILIELLEDDNSSEYLDKELFKKYWKIAQKRFRIIEPIINAEIAEKTIKNRTQKIKEIAKKHDLGYVTIYRWIKNFESTGLRQSLMPQKKLSGKGKTRLPNEVNLIINETIQQLYINCQQKSQKLTALEVIKRCLEAGLKPPHKNTIRSRILSYKEIDNDQYKKQ